MDGRSSQGLGERDDDFFVLNENNGTTHPVEKNSTIPVREKDIMFGPHTSGDRNISVHHFR